MDESPQREDVTEKLYPHCVPMDDDVIVMSPDERKRRLSRFAREVSFDTNGQPKYTTAIQAIDLLNKMENVYTLQPVINQDNRAIYISVRSQESQDLLDTVTGRLQEAMQFSTLDNVTVEGDV